MSEYSEKELLMLSNFVYLPCCLSNEKISDILDSFRAEDGSFTAESVQKAGVGGGLTSEDICGLFGEMDQEIAVNPAFGDLSAARRLNDGHVRALLYSDREDKNPVIAYRGTGGSKEAWTDNFEGGYENDTKCQKLAADFIRNDCAGYDKITVTGHSKGGNMSQYATIMCADKVEKCISFDGQGFCNDFINANSDKVAVAKGKIKSISAYNDYVNILLTSVAGEIVYVNNGKSVAEAHSSFSLLRENAYDENGNFVSVKKQSEVSSLLKNVTDKMVKVIDGYDDKDKTLISTVAGSAISSALCMEDSKEMAAPLGNVSGGVLAAFVTKLASIHHQFEEVNNPTIRNVFFDENGVKIASGQLMNHADSVRKIALRIAGINEDMSINIASKIYAQKRLEKIYSNLNRTGKNLESLSTTLDMILERYEGREKDILDRMTMTD